MGEEWTTDFLCEAVPVGGCFKTKISVFQVPGHCRGPRRGDDRIVRATELKPNVEPPPPARANRDLK